ncbi:hypothetical protein INT43_005281 [Umbelopsis isabellina]|uniref:Alpha-L-rhamnosidase n=1 Tax=Mortierella isabellina TaxID=91625 RepID=A0A8H7PH33_MORIS|nr:hypothetical protein INT43_005281 [Umbelopsis isabellina]
MRTVPLILACAVVPALAIPEANWRQYVRAPSSTTIYPKKVLSTHGNVTNAQGLIQNHGIATLSRPSTNDTVPYIELDFGINIVGFPKISFAGASDNHPGVRVSFSESTEYLSNSSDFTRSDNGQTITPGSDQHAVPSGASDWVDTYGCQHNGTQVCSDGLHGFRYMRIALDALDKDAPYTSPNSTVDIKSVSLNFTAFLGTPDTYTGWFQCSDEKLNQYWFDAAYTNEMVTDHFRATDVDPRDAATPTLEGKLVLFDGAKRDRDPYIGDIAVSGRTAYLTHNISEAAMNVLADMADHQRSDGWIPPASINNYTLPLFDYALYWVTTSWDYVLYNGDMDYAKTYYTHLTNVLDKFYASVTDAKSLLNKGMKGTDGYGDYAFLPRTGEVTYYNALYVEALKNAATWATSLKDTTSADRWTKRASAVSTAINAHLWDDSVGAYLDTSNATAGVRHAQDGNSIAVIAGVANASRANSSLDYISKNMQQPYGNAFYDSALPGVDNTTERVYAFISYFELQARFLANQANSALEEIDRLYGWMSSQDPGVTYWEGIGPGGSKYEQSYTSLAHGWSTGVLPILSNFVLGIMPTGPGFSTWSVKPYPGNLDWASGQVATPHGPISASWTRSSKSFELDITAPAGTKGLIAVPTGSHILLNGRPLASGSYQVQDGYAQLNVTSGGSYKIQVN